MPNHINNKKLSQSRYIAVYIKAIMRLIVLALIIGAICGVVGALFYQGVVYATRVRESHKWLLFLLPLAGLAIAFIYEKLEVENVGTDTVIDSVQENKRMHIKLVPAIFLATILTHLGGGSSGKEGAALQIGGDIGNNIGRLGHLRHDDLKLATMTGMAAFFSAIFGTPLTATAFVVMFIKVGHVPQYAVLPCFVSSYSAIWISKTFGVIPFSFHLNAIKAPSFFMIRVVVLGLLCGLLASFMCDVFHGAERLYQKVFPNKYIRILVGGLIVIGLTLLEGSGRYNGAGNISIVEAVELGKAPYTAFILKLIFTAVTLGAGYKGGEIVPTFFIGASFGCIIGPFLGLPAGFSAAIGMAAIFGGATNTIIAPILLSVESFGAPNIGAFAIACAVSYVASGYKGLYYSQKIRYSKVRPREVNMTANTNKMVRSHSLRANIRLLKKKHKKASNPQDEEDKRP